MKIKHSKYKNTGLIFELLVKQIAADTLSNRESPAVTIIKKYYTGKTSLVREFKLYKLVGQGKNISQSKAEAILSTITEVSRQLDQKALKSQKYKLIAEIKENYDLAEFFAIQVRDYKPLAALYCLLEAQNNTSLVDPSYLVENKTTILEHLTAQPQEEEEVKGSLIEEYAKYDKDLRMLTFRILLEKFNDRYKDLLPEQKNILREFITSVDSTARLRNIVNKELKEILTQATKLAGNVKNEVVRIKLSEVIRNIKPLSNKERITDTHLVNLMQYYDLLNELKAV